MPSNKDDMSSPNFSITNGKSSSSFQRTVCMSDWWLTNSENQFQGKRLAVAGISSRGNPLLLSSTQRQRAIRVFNSAPIVIRYDPFTLETADGICVVLESLINKSRTSENGFSSEVVDRFMLGFPPYWEQYAVTEEDKNASNCIHVIHEDKNELKVSEDMSVQSSFPSVDPAVEKHAATEETYQMNITSTSLNSDTLRSFGGNDQNPASGSMNDEMVRCTHVSENNKNLDGERLYSSLCATIQPGEGLGLLERSPKHSKENVLRRSKRKNKDVTSQEMDQVNITSSNLRVRSDGLNNQDKGNRKNPSSASSVDHKIKKCTLASKNLDGVKQNSSQFTTIQFKEGEQSRKSQDHSVLRKNKCACDMEIGQSHTISNSDRVCSYALRSLDQQNPKSRNKCAPASKMKKFGGEQNNLSCTSVQSAKVTPCNEKSRTKIFSPESLSCKRSKSGRLLLPTLQFWRNQLPVYDVDGKITGIQEELPVLESRGTPSKLRERQTQQI